MTHHHHQQHTGYLLGKVGLEGAIRSEVLANLVETLIQKYHTPSSDSSLPNNNKKQFKFNEHHKYSVECSERGLKLTSPSSSSSRSKDEGFESDSESIRSIRILTTDVELDLSNLINHLDLSTPTTTSTPSEQASPSSSDSSPAPSSPGGTSLDSTSLLLLSSSSSSDDNNSSSSGNGSDSDEFKVDDSSHPSRNVPSPFWEILPNLSSFQSYLIEDVVFCHCDTLHPSTLVWVVRHLDKMVALVTTFRTRSEAEQLFQTYRELRVKLKPVKYKINPILGLKMASPNSGVSEGPGSLMMMMTSPEEIMNSNSPPAPFASLAAQPTEILQESSHASPLFNYEGNKSLDFEGMFVRGGHQISSGTGSLLLREPLSRTGSNSLSLHNHVYISNPNIVRFGVPENNNEDNNDSNNHLPARPQRKVAPNSNSNPTPAKNQPAQNNNNHQPILLVPLKTESSVTTLKTQYPKESYLYHVMGRSGTSSSTFAPYQRSLNFLPHQQYPPGVGGAADYWGQQQLLVPFSSWMELAGDPQNNNGGKMKLPVKMRTSRSGGGGRTVPNLPKGTTSKILLRDAAGRDSMWASLSQRFKKNVRENLIPKLNGMWTGSENGGGGGGPGRKKRAHKKVTFNAWATVQMV